MVDLKLEGKHVKEERAKGKKPFSLAEIEKGGPGLPDEFKDVLKAAPPMSKKTRDEIIKAVNIIHKDPNPHRWESFILTLKLRARKSGDIYSNLPTMAKGVLKYYKLKGKA